MPFCSKCGAQINEGAQFCPKCGQLVAGTTPEQQVYYSQQQYVDQPSEEPESWISKVWHSKWSWIAGVVLVLIIVAANRSNSDDLEKQVEKEMVKKFHDDGQKLVVKELVLIHENGNNYSGLAKCTLDGENIEYDVKVVSDGRKFKWECTPTGEYIMKAIDDAMDEAQKEFEASIDKAQREFEASMDEAQREFEASMDEY